MTDKDITKICGICGDKALGYNFNAITCESCKAFFRRNALRTKEFKCPFDGNCTIDLVTRRFCQRCRLKKCFDIGMKKVEWILSDEEKQMKRSKIFENRKRKQTDSEVSKDVDSTTTSEPNLNQMSEDSQSFETNMSRNLTKEPEMDVILNHFDSNSNCCEKPTKTSKIENTYNLFCDSLVKSSYFDESNECLPIEVIKTNISSTELELFNQNSVITNNSNDIYKTNCITSNEKFNTKRDNFSIIGKMNDIPEIVYRKAIELEFASIPIRKSVNELNSNNYFEFNELESNKLSELFNALQVLRDPLSSITSEVTGILDALKMTDQAVRRLIKMSKRISAFKSLCQHDQIALLKGGCTELIILRSVISYNYEREYYTIVMAKGNVYEAHKQFMVAFKKEWNSDKTILDLLIAITLFSPERQNIIHKDIIKLEHQIYMYLLQRYLEIKYSSKCEAKSKFLRLITKLEELHILNEEHIRMYLDADPNDFGPLLIEIFDLKP